MSLYKMQSVISCSSTSSTILPCLPFACTTLKRGPSLVVTMLCSDRHKCMTEYLTYIQNYGIIAPPLSLQYTSVLPSYEHSAPATLYHAGVWCSQCSVTLCISGVQHVTSTDLWCKDDRALFRPWEQILHKLNHKYDIPGKNIYCSIAGTVCNDGFLLNRTSHILILQKTLRYTLTTCLGQSLSLIKPNTSMICHGVSSHHHTTPMANIFLLTSYVKWLIQVSLF